MQYKDLEHFDMPEACENGLDLANSCIYYAH